MEEKINKVKALICQINHYDKVIKFVHDDFNSRGIIYKKVNECCNLRQLSEALYSATTKEQELLVETILEYLEYINVYNTIKPIYETQISFYQKMEKELEKIKDEFYHSIIDL